MPILPCAKNCSRIFLLSHIILREIPWSVSYRWDLRPRKVISCVQSHTARKKQNLGWNLCMYQCKAYPFIQDTDSIKNIHIKYLVQPTGHRVNGYARCAQGKSLNSEFYGSGRIKEEEGGRTHNWFFLHFLYWFTRCVIPRWFLDLTAPKPLMSLCWWEGRKKIIILPEIRLGNSKQPTN